MRHITDRLHRFAHRLILHLAQKQGKRHRQRKSEHDRQRTQQHRVFQNTEKIHRREKPFKPFKSHKRAAQDPRTNGKIGERKVNPVHRYIGKYKDKHDRRSA